MGPLRGMMNRKGLIRLLFFSLALAALIYVFSYGELKEPTWLSWSTPLSGAIIVLDPGHGGMDGGAESRSGIVEKGVTLSIALYLRDYLQQAGALVLLTREDDRDLARSGEGSRKEQDLRNRVDLINHSSADIAVSIHLNSFPSPSSRGAQTFYNPNRKENAVLAHLIQEEFIRNLQNTSRKPKANQDLYLLRSIHPVGCLVEAGFLSNPEEAELLVSPQYQKKVAICIYRGILRYFSGETVGD